MRNAPDVTDGIVPIGKFKTHISRMARQLRETHRPIVVTQNGQTAMVVLSPEAYERLSYSEWVRTLLEERIREAEAQPGIPHDEAMREIQAELERFAE